MIKLQQFNVMSLNYNRLKNNDFKLNLSLFEAFENDELIALADNKCLRAIREITNHSYSKEKLDKLFKDRKELSKQVDSKENKKKIRKINNQICEMLYIKEFVSIEFPSDITKKQFNEFNKKGFSINGIEYTWLLCGAGHQRTNRSMYCAKNIYNQLDIILSCGAKLPKMVLAKYNAYYALSSSATFEVTTPRVVVIPDKEIQMVKSVDWVNEDNSIERTEKELTFNLFDGMGLISPKMAEIWSKDLDLDYLPSSFVCRATFVKGNLMVFDFHKFAKEIYKGNKIKDVYGNTYKIGDIDVILTQSQFKLWNAYDSWEHYKKCLKYSGFGWGVSRYAPKEDKNCIRMNYQFLQVLNLNDDEILELCKPTIEWIKGVCGNDITKMQLYLLGKLADRDNTQEIWDNIQDSFLKALLMDNRLINDSYIKNRILKSLNKRIKESYIGKILVNGNYQEMFADGYAFCEHAFGMEMKGLLKENEHYSCYWNERNVDKVVAMRSPLTWRSEVNLLNLQNNEKVNEWFKYMKSGIIYNVWGVDNMLHAGSDFDGDGVVTTNNSLFLKGRYGGVPVTYEPKPADKEIISKHRLQEVAVLGFNTKIGYITNLSTSMYEMQSKYQIDSMEFNELNNRLKLCCYQQSAQIDNAKGIKTRPMPSEWTRGKKGDDFTNSLIVEDRPYFMRYLYNSYNTKYKDVFNDFDRYTKITLGKSFKELLDNNELNPNEKEIVDYYLKKLGFLKTKGTMNRICYCMEENLKEVKNISNIENIEEIFSIIKSKNFEIEKIDNDKLNLLLEKFEEYKNFKKNKCLNESQYNTYEQYYKALRNECMSTISNNLEEITNLAIYICYKLYPKKSKDFVWDVFGKGIVANMFEKYDKVLIPLRDETNGDIEYLNQRYSLKELELN